MIGPAGYGAAAYVPSEDPLDYQVQFQNDPTATAPAQHVVVTDTLDPNLDLSTFSLSEIDFANQTIVVPPGLDNYETTVPMNANGTSIVVDVERFSRSIHPRAHSGAGRHRPVHWLVPVGPAGRSAVPR